MAQWLRICLQQEMWVQSLGREDPLEKEMSTNSVILVGIILWTEESGKLQSIGLQGDTHDWAVEHTHTQIYLYGSFFEK